MSQVEIQRYVDGEMSEAQRFTAGPSIAWITPLAMARAWRAFLALAMTK